MNRPLNELTFSVSVDPFHGEVAKGDLEVAASALVEAGASFIDWSDESEENENKPDFVVATSPWGDVADIAFEERVPVVKPEWAVVAVAHSRNQEQEAPPLLSSAPSTKNPSDLPPSSSPHKYFVLKTLPVFRRQDCVLIPAAQDSKEYQQLVGKLELYGALIHDKIGSVPSVAGKDTVVIVNADLAEIAGWDMHSHEVTTLLTAHRLERPIVHTSWIHASVESGWAVPSRKHRVQLSKLPYWEKLTRPASQPVGVITPSPATGASNSGAYTNSPFSTGKLPAGEEDARIPAAASMSPGLSRKMPPPPSREASGGSATLSMNYKERMSKEFLKEDAKTNGDEGHQLASAVATEMSNGNSSTGTEAGPSNVASSANDGDVPLDDDEATRDMMMMDDDPTREMTREMTRGMTEDGTVGIADPPSSSMGLERLFSGVYLLVISLDSLDEEESSRLKKRVRDEGGFWVDDDPYWAPSSHHERAEEMRQIAEGVGKGKRPVEDLVPPCITHILANGWHDVGCELATRVGIPVVTAGWVQMCLAMNEIVSPRLYPWFYPPRPYPIPEFQGMSISVSGFPAQDNVRKRLLQCIQEVGAEAQSALNAKATHLIAKAPEGQKYSRIVNARSAASSPSKRSQAFQSVIIVPLAWFKDCWWSWEARVESLYHEKWDDESLLDAPPVLRRVETSMDTSASPTDADVLLQDLDRQTHALPPAPQSQESSSLARLPTPGFAQQQEISMMTSRPGSAASSAGAESIGATSVGAETRDTAGEPRDGELQDVQDVGADEPVEDDEVADRPQGRAGSPFRRPPLPNNPSMMSTIMPNDSESIPNHILDRSMSDTTLLVNPEQLRSQRQGESTIPPPLADGGAGVEKEPPLAPDSPMEVADEGAEEGARDAEPDEGEPTDPQAGGEVEEDPVSGATEPQARSGGSGALRALDANDDADAGAVDVDDIMDDDGGATTGGPPSDPADLPSAPSSQLQLGNVNMLAALPSFDTQDAPGTLDGVLGETEGNAELERDDTILVKDTLAPDLLAEALGDVPGDDGGAEPDSDPKPDSQPEPELLPKEGPVPPPTAAPAAAMPNEEEKGDLDLDEAAASQASDLGGAASFSSFAKLSPSRFLAKRRSQGSRSSLTSPQKKSEDLAALLDDDDDYDGGGDQGDVGRKLVFDSQVPSEVSQVFPPPRRIPPIRPSASLSSMDAAGTDPVAALDADPGGLAATTTRSTTTTTTSATRVSVPGSGDVVDGGSEADSSPVLGGDSEHSDDLMEVDQPGPASSRGRKRKAAEVIPTPNERVTRGRFWQPVVEGDEPKGRRKRSSNVVDGDGAGEGGAASAATPAAKRARTKAPVAAKKSPAATKKKTPVLKKRAPVSKKKKVADPEPDPEPEPEPEVEEMDVSKDVDEEAASATESKKTKAPASSRAKRTPVAKKKAPAVLKPENGAENAMEADGGDAASTVKDAGSGGKKKAPAAKKKAPAAKKKTPPSKATKKKSKDGDGDGDGDEVAVDHPAGEIDSTAGDAPAPGKKSAPVKATTKKALASSSKKGAEEKGSTPAGASKKKAVAAPSAKGKGKGKGKAGSETAGTGPVVAVGGRDTDKANAKAAVKALGGAVVVGEPAWTPDVTIVVASDLKRTVRQLAGIAAGLWIVRPTWIEASQSSGEWIAPDDFEWTGTKMTGSGQIWQGCARASRLQKEKTGQLAFSGLTVAIAGELEPVPNHALELILRAGGATMWERRSASPPDYIVVSSPDGLDGKWTHSSSALTEAVAARPEAPIVSSKFFMDWLMKVKTSPPKVSAYEIAVRDDSGRRRRR